MSNESSSSSSGSLSAKVVNLASGMGPLPTLHEDMEFVPSSTVPLSHTPGKDKFLFLVVLYYSFTCYLEIFFHTIIIYKIHY